MRRGSVFIAAFLAASCVPAGAQSTPSARVVQTMDTGAARALGMGNAVTALADDLESILWNPAGLARLETRQSVYGEALSTNLKGMRFVGYAQPDKETPGGALSYLRVSNNAYNISETSLIYSFGQNLSKRISYGANVRYSRYKRDEQGQECFNADLGLLCDLGQSSTLGIAVLNATEPRIMDGRVVSDTVQLPAFDAPRLVNVGLAFRFQPYVEPGKLGVSPRRYRTRVGIDLFDALDEWRRELRFGVEQELGSRLAVRAGLVSSAPTLGLRLRSADYALNAGVVFARDGGHVGESMVSLTTAY